MSSTLMFNLLALAALVPAALLPLRGDATARDGVFWALLALAVLGPFLWAGYAMSGVWKSGLSITLWVTIAAAMTLFAVICVATREAWRLTPLMAPYMLVLGALATVMQSAPEGGLSNAAPRTWVIIHIVVAIATYALVTVGAVAALAAFMRERALKLKRPNRLAAMLPSVADCEHLSVRLLAWGEGILGIGLATGMATLYMERGIILVLDHKTVLSIAAFVIIGALLWVHQKTGIRGRRAARIVLLAYLLLVLATVGVKLVTDVLMA